MQSNDTHQHHHHHHDVNIQSIGRAFIWGIVLNALFVVIEFVLGLLSNSIGLISDAGHNLSDVASLILAMVAFKLMKVRATEKYTYGFKRVSILVSLINAIILLVAVFFICYESISKLIHPVYVQGGIISITAAVGVIVNGFTAWLFIKDKEKDLNVKGAYLHMAADALVSIGVVVSGIVIMLTGWYFVDGIIGIVVAMIIVYSTIDLLKDSIRLALDGVAKNIDLNEVVEHVKSVDNVQGVHHVHIWALSTTENALTAHVCIKDVNLLEETKHLIKEELNEHNITHSTLEFETPGNDCHDVDCMCKD